MGKRTLLTGMIVGASIGGLISLFNKDARRYAKDSLSQSYEKLTHYAKNPTTTVSQMKKSVISLNKMIASNTKSAVNTLELVEDSLNKVLKK